MPDLTTSEKTYQHVKRQRIENPDWNTLSDLALQGDYNHIWSLLADWDGVMHGFAVSAPLTTSAPVTAGVALQAGKFLKLGGADAIPIDPNTDPTNSRIDSLYINGYKDTDSDNHNPRVLSALTRETATNQAIGTGDGSTKKFDLKHAQVDLETLVVKVAGAEVGGWNFLKGLGALGVDQIIFATAPASGAITADYQWINGGVEATATGQPSRKTRAPVFGAAKGTPAGSPVAPAVPAGAIKIAEITLPGGWTTGNSGVAVDNTKRDSLLFEDSDVNSYSPKSPTAPGGILGALRGKHQVLHGMRLKWKAADKLVITPGWGVAYGTAFRLSSELEVTLSSIGAGWRYVYAELPTTATRKPGSELVDTDIKFTGAVAPQHNRDDPGNPRRVYLGAVYNTGVDTMRPFYTHGDMVFWEAPTAIDLSTTTEGSPVNKTDLTNWVPDTGRLCCVRLEAQFTATSDYGELIFIVRSHKAATGKIEPSGKIGLGPTPNTTSEERQLHHWLRLEEDSSLRYFHKQLSVTNGSIDSADLTCLGYLDDYRTMGAAGAPDFY